MFNGSGCSVGRGSYAGEREGDCSATAPARWRAKATLAVCVLAAFSSQPQPFLPPAPALPPPPTHPPSLPTPNGNVTHLDLDPAECVARSTREAHSVGALARGSRRMTPLRVHS